MRKRLNVLPQTSLALGYLPTLAGGRFDLLSAGCATEDDPKAYDWDNRRREEALLLQYTLEGEGRIGDPAKRRAQAVPAHHLMVCDMPSATRYWLPRGGSWRFVWLILGGDAAMALGQQLIAEHGRVIPLPPATPAAVSVVDVYKDAVAGALNDELEINLRVHRLLIELQRAVKPKAEGTPDAIAAARDLIERRFTDPTLGVEDLGDSAGYSRYHFSRLFKRHMGQSPYQYLLRRRIRHAMSLLAEGDEPVKRVALLSGFTDVSWFCATFRKHTGTTPAQARRQRREAVSSS